MSTYPTLSKAHLKGKRVLVRAGFDLPIEDGVIQDISRVEALVPTIKYILDHGASVILMSHQGRPKGKVDPEFTQRPLVAVIEKLLKTTVHFAPSCTGPEAKKMSEELKAGEILLLENLRYDAREEKNDPAFAKELASLGEIYVNDAFTNCHRAHASMVGIPKLLPSYMGLQLEQEVAHLSKVTDNPARPLVLIISGAKMETKVPVIEFFLDKGDDILVGGAIANTFIAAEGRKIGSSLCEKEEIDHAKDILKKSDAEDSAHIHVPTDYIVAEKPTEDSKSHVAQGQHILESEAIFDVGPDTIDAYISAIECAKSIIWNGPLGLYEEKQFAHASIKIAAAVKDATKKGSISVIGGGDTIDLHTRYGLDLSSYTFVSTGGGAMLEFVSGKKLPALEALRSS